MFTKQESVIYDFLCSECYYNQYSVVEIATALNHLQELDLTTKKADVKQILNQLEQRKFIAIRYSDDNVFCIKLLRQETPSHIPEQRQKKEPTTRQFSFKFFVTVFVTTFLSCFLAGLILLACAKLI